MKHATKYLLLALVVLPMSYAAQETMRIDMFPNTLQLSVDATGLEKYITFTTERVNNTAWRITGTLPWEMKEHLFRCWMSTNFPEQNYTCNLAELRTFYPELEAISDTNIRIAGGIADVMPIKFNGSTIGSVNYLEGTFSYVHDFKDKRLPLSIGAMTASVLVPTDTTHEASSGAFTEATFTISTRTEVAATCYANISIADGQSCLENEGTNALDAYFQANLTSPSNYTQTNWISATVQMTSTSVSAGVCELVIYNQTSATFWIKNTSSCTSAAEVTLNYNFSGSSTLNNIINGNKIVRLMAYLNSSAVTDDLNVDYMSITVDYNMTAPTNGAPSVTDNGTTAYITWTNTGDASNSSVNYGTTTALGTTATNTTNSTSHSVEINGLSGGTLYYYNITSTNDGGSDTDGTYNFTTDLLGSLTPCRSDSMFNITRHLMNINTSDDERSYDCDNRTPWYTTQGGLTWMANSSGETGYNFSGASTVYLNTTVNTNKSRQYNHSGVIVFSINNTNICDTLTRQTLLAYAFNTSDRFSAQIVPGAANCQRVSIAHYNGTAFLHDAYPFPSGSATLGNNTRHIVTWRFDSVAQTMDMRFDNLTGTSSATPATSLTAVERLGQKQDGLDMLAGRIYCYAEAGKYWTDDEMSTAYSWNCSNDVMAGADSCTDFETGATNTVDCTDGCTIDSNRDGGGGVAVFSGAGQITVTAQITNFATVQSISSCQLTVDGGYIGG